MNFIGYLRRSIRRTAVKATGYLSLRSVLLVPFLLQLCGTVTLIGYLSFRTGQATVENLAYQLMQELSDRTSQKLSNYLGTPEQINRLNAISLQENLLNPQDVRTLQDYFLKQLQVFHSVSSIYLGNQQGGVVGVERLENDYRAFHSSQGAAGTVEQYRLDEAGNRLEQLDTVPYVDFRNRPWFTAALETGQANWSHIHTKFNDDSKLAISSVYPVYDSQGQLELVWAIDIGLDDLDQFLRSLRLGSSGKVFVIERSGTLVSSSISPGLLTASQSNQRLSAVNSSDPLIQASTRYLLRQYTNLMYLNNSQQLSFSIRGQRHFLQVTPLPSTSGLDWLLVMVVPESDFTGRMADNTRITILLCLLALALAICIGGLTVRWVTYPLRQLSQAAKGIAAGQFDRVVNMTRMDEVGELANAFNLMAQTLQRSFKEMQTLNEALARSESRLTQFLEALPVGVAVHNADGTIHYLNQTAQRLLGQGVAAHTAPADIASTYHVYLTGTDQLYPANDLPSIRALRDKQEVMDTIDIHQGHHIISCLVRATPIFDAQGQVVYGIVAFQDITRQRQAQELLEAYSHTLEAEIAERTEALRQSEEKFRQIAENVRDVFWVHDPIAQKALYVSPAYEQIWGKSCESYYTNPTSFLESLHPDDRVQVAPLIPLSQQFPLEGINIEYRIVQPNGMVRWISDRAFPILNQQGQLYRIVGIARDITDRKQAEAALRQSEATKQQILKAIPDLILWMDQCGNQLERINGDGVKDLAADVDTTGMNVHTFLPPELAETRIEAIQQALKTGEVQVYEQTVEIAGEIQHEEVRVVAVGNDRLLVIVRNITDRKQMELALKQINLELEHLATLDGLTQTANRHRFDDYLYQEWHQLAREKQPISLIMCDVDCFKLYNDCYGHLAGDQCLVQVARAIAQAVKRSADLVARYGGEEFAVILPGTELAGAVTVAAAIWQAVHHCEIPHAASEVCSCVTLSLGVACVVPTLDAPPESLIVAADRALYDAKRQGRNRWVVAQ